MDKYCCRFVDVCSSNRLVVFEFKWPSDKFEIQFCQIRNGCVDDYFGRCTQYRGRRFGLAQPKMKNSDVIIGYIRITSIFKENSHGLLWVDTDNRYIISMKSQGFSLTPQDIMEEYNGCSVPQYTA